jgi:hypothetical protein
MNMRTITGIMLVLAVLLPIGANAQSLPAWPQTRALSAGETGWFTIPITQVGAVTLTLAWKNGPLTAKVITPSNTTIPVMLTSSPMRLPLNITATEVQKGPIWSLALTVPPTARLAAPVEVTVNYEGPAADSSMLQAFAARVAATRLTVSADLTKRFAQQVQQQITVNQQAQTTQIATQKLILGTQLLNSTKVASTVSGASISPLRTIATPLDAVRLTNVALSQPAQMISANPVRGIPGALVTLKAANLVPADRWSPDYVMYHTEVWFTINPNLPSMASISGVNKDTDGATLLQVRVPAAAAAVVNGYDGNVYIKSNSLNYTTNALPFRWDPTPKPAISSVAPLQAGTGIWVTLKGQNFTANDQVFFVTETGAEILTGMRYQSALALQAQVPAMGAVSNVTRIVSICLKSAVNGVAVRSNPITFHLLPPPTITSLDRANGLPGESLLINGAGFQNPVIHFQQPAGGKDYAVSPQSNEWNVSQAYVTLPEIPLVPINGMQVNVTVESNGVRSAPKLFTLMPILVEMPLPEVAWQNFKAQDSLDKTSYWSDAAYVNHYASGFFDYHDGTDTIAPTVTLRNGWKVVRIETRSEVLMYDSVNGHVSFNVPPVSASDLTVKVGWWIRCEGSLYAGVAYIIKGPKGVPYK